MSAAIRIPTAVFKNNPRPFVQQAKAGVDVIVTNEGVDDFRVVPVNYSGPPPISEKPLDPKLFQGIDPDEPAFDSE